jgi:PD-(D/E)XK nuclease superfamily
LSLLVPKSYTPREQFSPSGLSVLERCGWQWLLRYLRGVREDDLLSWDDAQHLERPVKPDADAPAIEHAKHRDAVKEHNRLTKRALGHAIHHAMQVYYDWHPPLVDVWRDPDWYQVCALATAGLRLLPSERDMSWLGTEVEVSLDIAGVRVFGFIDLIAHIGKGWRRRTKLIDYKSTGNLDWAPTPDEMLEDVAACFYALAVMVAEDSSEVDCLWVYFLTDPEKKPDAWSVEFTITREQAIATLTAHEERAELALEALDMWATEPDRARTLPVVQPNAMACGDFGGCVYHPDKERGLCRPPKLTTGQTLQIDTDKRELLTKRREYRRAAQQTQPRAASPSAPIAQARKKDTRHMAKSLADRLAETGDDNASGGGDASGGRGESRGGNGGESGSGRRERSSGGSSSSPSKAKGKGKKGPTLVLVVREDGKDDVELSLPEGTPLYERNLRAAEAILGE